LGRIREAVEYMERCVALEEAIQDPHLESDRQELEQLRAILRGES
jgi:hypothetical protein